LYWQSGGPGNPALMNHEKMNAIWIRLAERLAQIIQDESGYTITAKMAKHFLKVNTTVGQTLANFLYMLTRTRGGQVYQLGQSSFTGPRMHLVMLALPHALRGLIAEEVRLSLTYMYSSIYI